MRFDLEGLEVIFPYEYIYPEQLEYMRDLKRTLDAKGHCLLEMPTGTGKTVSLLSLITSYQAAHPATGKLVYCTRTVPEMEKALEELRGVAKYRSKVLGPAAGAMLGLGLSSRKNMCCHPTVSSGATRESVDSKCRQLTAPWVRARSSADASGRTMGTRPLRGRGEEGEDEHMDGPVAHSNGGGAELPDLEDLALCSYFEAFESRGSEVLLPPGVYTIDDVKVYGKEAGYCPYFMARHMIKFANVVVYNYQYMLDPKVSGMVSSELEKECVVVFDEAHNIDNICIDALSVNLRTQTLDGAVRNIGRLKAQLERVKEVDRDRLRNEYNQLVSGLARRGLLLEGGDANRGSAAGAAPFDATGDGQHARQPVDALGLMSSPVLGNDIIEEAVPGNVRKADHFLSLMRRVVDFLKVYMRTGEVQSMTPQTFLNKLTQEASTDARALKFCYDRLGSLMNVLELTDTDEFQYLKFVADFVTLLATYSKGFCILFEPFDDRMPGVPDPSLELACLDASLAMKPVFQKFASVVITSGTLSPLELYPRILDFTPRCANSIKMTLPRDCICPIVVTRGADQLALSSKFDVRDDPSVVRNYGELLVKLASSVPDGMVCFFVSYIFMDIIISKWHDMGVLRDVMKKKLVFIETPDVVETSLALDNYRRACDAGRGAVFFSVARGKVAEGVDFDRHYGRAVLMIGIPFQYTLSRTLVARLKYLRETFQVEEGDFLSFDAVRQAAQCVGRVVRSKSDYGLIVLADKRWQRTEKRSKLPGWIANRIHEAHLNLSTDMAVGVAQEFLRKMAQPLHRDDLIGTILLKPHQIPEALQTLKFG